MVIVFLNEASREELLKLSRQSKREAKIYFFANLDTAMHLTLWFYEKKIL